MRCRRFFIAVPLLIFFWLFVQMGPALGNEGRWLGREEIILYGLNLVMQEVSITTMISIYNESSRIG